MPRTRIAPTTATRKLCRLKPLMEPPMPNMVASQPPTTAPTIPRIQVRKNIHAFVLSFVNCDR